MDPVINTCIHKKHHSRTHNYQQGVLCECAYFKLMHTNVVFYYCRKSSLLWVLISKFVATDECVKTERNKCDYWDLFFLNRGMCTDSFITLPKHTSSPADIVRFPALGILKNPDKNIEKYYNFKRIYSSLARVTMQKYFNHQSSVLWFIEDSKRWFTKLWELQLCRLFSGCLYCLSEGKSKCFLLLCVQFTPQYQCMRTKLQCSLADLTTGGDLSKLKAAFSSTADMSGVQKGVRKRETRRLLESTDTSSPAPDHMDSAAKGLRQHEVQRFKLLLFWNTNKHENIRPL